MNPPGTKEGFSAVEALHQGVMTLGLLWRPEFWTPKLLLFGTNGWIRAGLMAQEGRWGRPHFDHVSCVVILVAAVIQNDTKAFRSTSR